MKISILAFICLLFGASSCSRVDDVQSSDKLLQVNVQMAASSPMATRGVVAYSNQATLREEYVKGYKNRQVRHRCFYKENP